MAIDFASSCDVFANIGEWKIFVDSLPPIDPKIWKKFKLKTVINDKSIKDTLLELITKYGK